MSAVVIDEPSNEGTTAWWFLDTLVVEHRRAAGMATTVLEMTLPVGHSQALHLHHTLDDTWYVLDGQMALRFGDDGEYLAEAGNWVSMPRGVPHSFRVVGDRPARILMVHDNSTFRDFVEELGVRTAERQLPPVPTFPSLEELARAGGAHQLAAIGPPMTEEHAEAIVANATRRR